MKIEIGESLVRTWVRHCKKCQLAELNWKPSPVWPGEVTPELEKLYNDGAVKFTEKVMKKTSSIRQFLGQAEIDVLGVRFGQGKTEKVIAADIAFHTHGLQYSNKNETAARVAKKLFRAALTLKLHFPGIPAEIVFLSPKVNPATVLGVREAKNSIQSFFKVYSDDFEFITIINDDFKELVLDEVTPLQNRVADTSELYLRAAQLVGLFDNCSSSPSSPSTHIRKSADNISRETLPIELVPNDLEEFRHLLIKKGAIIYEHYQNGEVKERNWAAGRMCESSDVIGNLRSMKDYRQGKWQSLGMKKLVVVIEGYKI